MTRDAEFYRNEARETEKYLDEEQNPDERAVILREAAGMWFEAGEFEKAEHRFSLARKLNTDGFSTPFHVAAAVACGNDIAETLLAEFLAKDLSWFDWQALGMAYSGIGELDKSLEFHTRAVHGANGSADLPTLGRVNASEDLRSAIIEREGVRAEDGLEPDDYDRLIHQWRARYGSRDDEFELPPYLDEPTGHPTDHVPGQPYIAPEKPGRNDPCHCGSGRTYKKCCIA